MESNSPSFRVRELSSMDKFFFSSETLVLWRFCSIESKSVRAAFFSNFLSFVEGGTTVDECQMTSEA
ncbi:hypothetical protein Pyn_26531 [Prunus yedoensis var. nudiflora]|uniref:Uncharacterized protein n=1 Tax=Prunus yedoensis var. nudiflora TaxID=2094558 RepID=A0A315A6K4_PRUYE|nr:hypothetical protein Pyn_26531 [Prunus yedoensis var. nudiflora]